MRPVTSVKKSPPMPMREVIATRVERPRVGRVLSSAMPGPWFADVEALAWFEGPQPGPRYRGPPGCEDYLAFERFRLPFFATRRVLADLFARGFAFGLRRSGSTLRPVERFHSS